MTHTTTLLLRLRFASDEEKKCPSAELEVEVTYLYREGWTGCGTRLQTEPDEEETLELVSATANGRDVLWLLPASQVEWIKSVVLDEVKGVEA